MDNSNHIRFNASDRSYFSILKKEIRSITLSAGFSEKKASEVDIVVAEITSNLVKHAGGGDILVRLVKDNENVALELISIDSGKGMTNPEKMEEDGVSTTNTLGHGLGSIKRLSDVYQLYSIKEWGTILLCRIYKEPVTESTLKPPVEIRSIVVAKPGEEVSGDGYCYKLDKERLQIFLGDGLGHGKEAHHAVNLAIDYYLKNKENSLIEILKGMNIAVKRSRGLVGTVASYSFKTKQWQVCGIGNIATRTQTGTTLKNHLSYNGIIGLNIPNTMKEQTWEHERGQIIILCSDGIKTRFDLQKYPGIFRYDLSILAAAIFKDNARETDDMSVLVSRINVN